MKPTTNPPPSMKNELRFYVLLIVLGVIRLFSSIQILKQMDDEPPTEAGLLGITSVRPLTNISAYTSISMSTNTANTNTNSANTNTNTTYTNHTTKVHVIFSTDCSSFQNWQSYLAFYNAYKVQQFQWGTVTRIASGCNENEIQTLQKHHELYIAQTMSDAFHIHFTPKFSQITNGAQKGKDYKFFNKPMGVLHWLNYMMKDANNNDADNNDADDNDNSAKDNAADNSNNNHHSRHSRHSSFLSKHDIVVLLDPDQILTQPITGDFSSTRSHSNKVQHGTPFGQMYGLGDKWTTFDLVNITQDEQSPAIHVSSQDAKRYYPVGPPYLATVHDMHRIAKKWAEYAPLVYEQYPHLLAEMYAYCIAAAHLNLKHQVMNTLMVSNTDMGRREEGWDLIDDLPPEQTCPNGNGGNYKITTTSRRNHNDTSPILPSVIHYCQRYMIGKWFFGKRKIPKDIFSCTSPLLQMPPIEESKSLYTVYDYAIPPPPHKPPGEHKHLRHPKREAFMFCYLTNAVNEAAMFYYEHHCHGTKQQPQESQKPSEPVLLWSVR